MSFDDLSAKQRKLLERIQNNSLNVSKKKVSLFTKYFLWIRFW